MLFNYAEAFNGNRKGFTMSIGGGTIPHKSYYNFERDETNFVFDYHIGHGFSEKDILVYGFHVDFAKYDHNHESSLHMSQFRSLNWHHYFKKSKENSLMTKLSLTYAGRGIRYLFGLGYQFKGNYQFDLYYWTDFQETSTKQLRLTFSYVAY